jgi:two-component system, NarL family, sensor kinase
VNRSAAARAAWSACVVSLALAGLGVVVLALSASTPIPPRFGFRGSDVVFAVAFATVGAVIASRRPQNPVGWLFCAAGVGFAVTALVAEYRVYAVLTRPGSLPLGPEVAWIAEWIWPLGFGVVACVMLLFPDGRPLSRRWWPTVWLAGIGGGMAAVGIALSPGPLAEFTVVSNPFGLDRAGPVIDILVTVGMLGLGLALLAAGVSLVLRFRRARSEQRQQLKWLAYATSLTATTLLVSVVSFLMSGTAPILIEVLVICALAAIPVASGVAILRYRLYDIDLLINRSLVYGALTATVIAVYVLVVGWLGAVFQARGSLGVSLVGAGVVAVLFAPARDRLQRAVNRLLYGDRDDPYGALSRLGQRLEAAAPPSQVLPEVAETVARALRLPYVAILSGGERTAAYGIPRAAGDQVLRIPLAYRGEQVGELVAEPRVGSDGFSAQDRRLLDDLARQVGVTIQAGRLTRDLQRSREHLVLAREEERRRLRRDLHDQLGPNLAAAALELDRARDLATTDLATADKLFEDLAERIREAVRDVRQLVDELRPPALDELGLLGALQEQIRRFANSPTSILLQAPDELGQLPAAVDLAAYRIACEALTNAIRHAEASQCIIRLAYTTKLELEVTDDGRGLPAQPRAGLGLASMRDRAAELGGSCTVISSPGHGTQVRAWLPVSEP